MSTVRSGTPRRARGTGSSSRASWARRSAGAAAEIAIAVALMGLVYGSPHHERRSRPLAHVDDPEHALVIHPRRAVDHRTEVQPIDPARHRRPHAEPELREVAGLHHR